MNQQTVSHHLLLKLVIKTGRHRKSGALLKVANFYSNKINIKPNEANNQH